MLKFKTVNIISVTTFVVFLFLRINYSISNWWVIFILLTWLTLIVIGSFHIRWNYFLKANHKNHLIKDNVIALTFDDGPNPEYTLKVLTLLKKHHAKATFFALGRT